MEGGVLYREEKISTLYTMNGPVRIKACKIKCRSGVCEIVWNGEKENVFRSTAKLCAGDEIGWDFVEHVLKTKCSFTAYVELMDATYKRLGHTEKFMSAPSFRHWFKCWASYQHREFRKPCFGCGDKIEALASDGTMIGNLLDLLFDTL